MPEPNTSRHVFICVSGFLSEDCVAIESWKYLADECRQKGFPLYTVRWEAKDTTQLTGDATRAAARHLAPALANTRKPADLLTASNLSNIAKFIGGAVNNGAGTFKAARTNARVTGKLLAHFLALESEKSPLFGDHTFSLMGFSLGSQVVKSCVNRLKKLG